MSISKPDIGEYQCRVRISITMAQSARIRRSVYILYIFTHGAHQLTHHIERHRRRESTHLCVSIPWTRVEARARAIKACVSCSYKLNIFYCLIGLERDNFILSMSSFQIAKLHFLSRNILWYCLQNKILPDNFINLLQTALWKFNSRFTLRLQPVRCAQINQARVEKLARQCKRMHKHARLQRVRRKTSKSIWT